MKDRMAVVYPRMARPDMHEMRFTASIRICVRLQRFLAGMVDIWPVICARAPSLGARGSRCAVQRHILSAGAIPARQVSFQPVAIGTAVEVTKQSKLSIKGSIGIQRACRP